MTFIVNEYTDKLQINSLFANEYAESQYTKRLRGSMAKVKANIVQILPQLIENATNRRWIANKNAKHINNARSSARCRRSSGSRRQSWIWSRFGRPSGIF